MRTYDLLLNKLLYKLVQPLCMVSCVSKRTNTYFGAHEQIYVPLSTDDIEKDEQIVCEFVYDGDNIEILDLNEDNVESFLLASNESDS